MREELKKEKDEKNAALKELIDITEKVEETESKLVKKVLI